MTELSHKIEHARAMLRAGNYKRSKELCREIIEKEGDNFDGFEILFETHMELNKHEQALAACNWRLERVPNCRETHLLKFLPLGHLKRKKDAKSLITSVRLRFGDYPFHLEQSEILYSHFFKSSRDTIRRLKKARKTASLPEDWIDEIESYERAKSGHIFSSQKLIAESLERDPQNYDALYTLAVTRFYLGRLFSAIRLARQAQRLRPEHSAECKEILFASYVGIFPPFWGAQFFIIWVATLTTRIPWILRAPFNIAGFLMAFLIQGFIMMPLGLLMGGNLDEPHINVTRSVVNIFAILQFIWMIYLLFGFQHVGQMFSRQKKDIKLSKNY